MPVCFSGVCVCLLSRAYFGKLANQSAVGFTSVDVVVPWVFFRAAAYIHNMYLFAYHVTLGRLVACSTASYIDVY